MRRDGAFRCCHPGESYKDSIDGENGIGIPGDDDIHRRFEFFICSSDSGFAIGLFEVLPGQGSKHGVNVGVILHGLLEEIQDGHGDGWVETEHYIPESLVINVEPEVNLGLVFGGFGRILSGLGLPFLNTNSLGLVVGSREFVLNNLPLALRKEVVHHHGPPSLPVH